MSKALIYISLVVVICIIILFSLVQFAGTPNSKLNGFTRQHNSTNPPLLSSIFLPEKVKLKSIAGLTDNIIYFATLDPRKIITSDYSLRKFDTIKLDLPLNREIIRINEIAVDSPKITIYAGNFHTNIYFNMSTSELDTIKIGNMTYSKAVRISDESVASRAFDSIEFKQVFQIADSRTGQIRKQATIIENTDGGFATAGILKWDDILKHLIYVQIYSNTFYCIDTNLNIVFTNKTIDTTNTNKISTREFDVRDSAKSLIPQVPLSLVNYDCTIDGKYLFILSSLQADNETNKFYSDFTSIDVYSTTNGSYLTSFYIPVFEKNKPLNIAVNKGNLIALFPKGIAIYDINGIISNLK